MHAETQAALTAGWTRIAGILRNVTLSVPSAATYDPDAGTHSTSVTTTQARALVVGVAGSEVANGLAQAGDRRVYLLRPGVELTTACRVTISGKVYNVVEVREDPTSTLIILRVRR